METGIEIKRDQLQQVAKKPGSSYLLLGLRILVGLVILALLIRMVSVEKIAAAFSGADLNYVGAAFLLLIFNLGIQITKWRYLLSLVDGDASWKTAGASFFFGMSLGSVTPGHLGEIPGRAWQLQNGFAPQTIGLTVIDKVQVMIVLAMGGLPAYFFLSLGNNWQTFVLSCTALFCLFYLFFGLRDVVRLLDRLNLKTLKHRWTGGVIEPLDLFRANHLIVTFILTLGFYFVLFLQVYLLLNAFSVVSLIPAFIGFAAMMFAKSLIPISIGDLGVREASSVYFFSLVAVAETTAFNAALSLFFINVFLPALVGVFFLPKLQIASAKHESAPLSLRDSI